MDQEIKVIRQFYWLFLLFLFGIYILYFFWITNTEKENVEILAREQAVSSFQKDLIYRNWASMHGGVYVPVSKYTKSNPYLDVPNKDIITPDSQRLTLMNPAYMTRQVHELQSVHYKVKGHITSLNPINPVNIPDNWERSALEQFEQGINEVSSVEEQENKLYLRYMKVLKTETSCLKCHSKQGYKEGNVRGGISVSVPLEPYYKIANKIVKKHMIIGSSTFIVIFFLSVFWYKKFILSTKKEIQAKKDLVYSENKFHSVIDNAAEAVYMTDMEGKIIEINKKSCQMLGYTRDEFLGKTVMDLDLKYSNIEDLKKLWNRLEKDDTIIIHGTHVNKEGKLIPVEINISSLYIDNKRYIIGFARDVSERLAFEEALKNSNERYKLLSDSTFEGIAISVKGKMIDVNKQLAEMHGYTKKELIQKRLDELVFPEDYENVMKHIIGNNPDPYYLRSIKKNGEIIHLEVRGKKISLNGKEHRLTVLRDITDLVKSNEKIVESEFRYKQLSNLTIEGILLVKKHIIVDVNQSFTELSGLKPEEIVGKNLFVLSKYAEYFERFENISETNDKGPDEITWKRMNGEKIYCEIEWQNFNIKNNPIMVIALRNITEKKTMEKEIIKAIIDTEEKERNRFSQELHDGLGPILSNIQMYFQWLADDDENKMSVIEKGNAALTTAFNTLKEISFNLSPHILHNFGLIPALNSFIDGIYSLESTKINLKSNIKNRINDGVEISVYRIMTELINNSMKYASAEKINININVSEGTLHIVYEDNGIGFDMSKESKGHGLYNIKSRIKTLNGFFSIVSSTDKGFLFDAKIPCEIIS